MPKKIADSFRGRTFRVGTYSTVIAVFALALVVLVNLFAEALPTSFAKRDLTAAKLYSIGEQTQQLVSAVEEDITVYLIAQTGEEDTILLEMLERYQALNDRISVKQIDPALYPNFAAEYTDQEVEANSLIVVSEKRSRYIANSSIYLYDSDSLYDHYYNGTELVPTSFDGEKQVTSAIDFVTTDNLPVLYTLAGHGETALGDSLTADISMENIEVRTLRLLETEVVPGDAAVLLIYLPKEDISSVEYDMIMDYMLEGGSCLIFADTSQRPLPNVEALLEGYGVEIVPGIVLEPDDRYHFIFSNTLLCEVTENHSISVPLQGYYIMYSNAQGLRQIETSRVGIAYHELLKTSDTAYANVDNDNTAYEEEAGDTKGPFSLAVALEHYLNNGAVAKIVVIAGSDFLNGINTMYSTANVDLFLNSLDWLTARDSNITIRSKNLQDATLVIDTNTARLWNILFIGVIPVVILALGGIVVYRRKKR